MLETVQSFCWPDRSALIKLKNNETIKAKDLHLMGDSLYFKSVNNANASIATIEVRSFVIYKSQIVPLLGLTVGSGAIIAGGVLLANKGGDEGLEGLDKVFGGILIGAAGGTTFALGMIALHRRYKDKRLYYYIE